MPKFFETVIRVPMPEGSLAWGKIAATIEPAFDALAKGLAKAGVDGVEITQRETRVRGPSSRKSSSHDGGQIDEVLSATLATPHLVEVVEDVAA